MLKSSYGILFRSHVDNERNARLLVRVRVLLLLSHGWAGRTCFATYLVYGKHMMIIISVLQSNIGNSRTRERESCDLATTRVHFVHVYAIDWAITKASKRQQHTYGYLFVVDLVTACRVPHNYRSREESKPLSVGGAFGIHALTSERTSLSPLGHGWYRSACFFFHNTNQNICHCNHTSGYKLALFPAPHGSAPTPWRP